MRHSFAAVTTPTPVDVTATTGRFSFSVDESWFQGRGAYGGVLGAALLEAMIVVTDDELRRPRSLTVHFCSPVPAGRHEIEVRLERAGSRVTHVSARALSGEKVLGLASGTFAAPRDAKVAFSDAHAPPAPPFETVPAVGPTTLMPPFCQHFEYRFCLGQMPFSGAEEARLGGWIRPRSHERLGYGLCVGLLDAFPPAASARKVALSPAASVDLHVQFFEPLPLGSGHTDGRALLDARAHIAAGGYTDEQAELWSEDGRLLAHCRQLIALL